MKAYVFVIYLSWFKIDWGQCMLHSKIDCRGLTGLMREILYAVFRETCFLPLYYDSGNSIDYIAAAAENAFLTNKSGGVTYRSIQQ